MLLINGNVSLLEVSLMSFFANVLPSLSLSFLEALKTPHTHSTLAERSLSILVQTLIKKEKFSLLLMMMRAGN